MGEVDVEQWLADLERQPQPVDRQRFVVGETQPAEVQQRRVGGEPELGGGFGVCGAFELEDTAALFDAAALDELEQAVQRTERLLELATVDRRADAALALDDAVGAELGDGMTGGVAAHLVDLDQLAVGREAVLEMPHLQAAAQLGLELGPQRERARPVDRPGAVAELARHNSTLAGSGFA